MAIGIFVPAMAAAQPGTGETAVDRARILPARSCTSAAPGEIVVCGRSNPDRYRIPEELRDSGPAERSWSAAAQDAMDSAHAGGASVGLGGSLQYLRQVSKEWRAERERLGREKRELERALDEQ
jgi:hypothetical protein